MAWTKICTTHEFTDTDRKTFTKATIFKIDDQFYATENRCPHMGYPMSKGTLREGVITCAWHNWEFDLNSGGCYRGACDDLMVYDLKIEGEDILINLNDSDAEALSILNNLSEAMRSGDTYQQAKFITKSFKANLSPIEVIKHTLKQAYRHSSRNHQTEQAVYESQAITDGFELSNSLDNKSAITTLLHGIKTASGSTGDRMKIDPLPQKMNDSAYLSKIINRYIYDSSALAIERALLSTEIDKAEIKRILIDAITQPYLLFQRESITTLSAILHVEEMINDDQQLDTNFQAMSSWILGKRRNSPNKEQREAIEWLEENTEGINSLPITFDKNEDTNPPTEELQMILTGDSLQEVLIKFYDWLKGGHEFVSLLNAFSLLSARRVARLWLNNGGLWNSATEGVRLCNSIRQMQSANPQACAKLLFNLAAYYFETRWLQNGDPYKPEKNDFDATSNEFQKAFEANDVKAKSIATSFIKDKNFGSEDLSKITAILVNEDLNLLQLNSIVAFYKEQSHLDEWQPYMQGLITYMLDMKAGQNTKSAAKFGLSYLS